MKTQELEQKIISQLREQTAIMKEYTRNLQKFAKALTNFAENMIVLKLKS